MAVETRAYFAGTEIGNTARTVAYMRRRGGRAQINVDCTCVTAPMLGEQPYRSPALDPAPWYDPDEPDSGEFAGVWIETIAGLSDGPVARSTTQRIGNGAVLSGGRLASKTLTVTAWLFASSCCGATYGLRWLNAVLYAACNQCEGDDWCFLSCCPTTTAPNAAGSNLGPDGLWWNTAAQTRTLKSASLIAAPTVVQRAQGCDHPQSSCGAGEPFRPMIQVQWTMSTDPQVWRNPVAISTDTVWPLPGPTDQCNVVWSTDCCDVQRPGCSCATPCAPDTQCPSPPPPPQPDPLAPACVCTPLYVVRQCVDIPPDVVPTWESGALVITLRAGEKPIRNMIIRVWPNPADKPAEQLGDCQTCGEYYVTYVPAGAELVIDGRTCTSTLTCPGEVTQNAAQYVYGSGGGPLDCITLSCGIRYSICADADTKNIAPDATMSVAVARAELVA